MLLLIIGGNGSGKSAYAEKLVCTTENFKRYYIATMQPYGDEGRARVEKHRRQRKDMNFKTIEEPSRLSALQIDPDSVVLLEDVSNLLANIVFDEKDENGAKTALREIKMLHGKCRDLVIVTISGFSEEGYTSETRDYINALNTLNDKLFKLADKVYEMSGNLPKLIK